MAEWIPTPESSHVSQIKYEPETQDLFVQFENGQVYQYQNVPEKIWGELLASQSKGRYVNIVLARRFKYQEA